MAVGNIIAVWGPPGSGKTVLSVKTGIELAGKGKSVLIICADRTVPAMPVLFPNALPGSLRSLGEIFAASDISEQEILSSAAVIREYPDVLFLGFTIGENIYTWPAYSENRASVLLKAAAELADTVIVDCCSDANSDPLTSSALKTAGAVIRISNPELKTVSFYESQNPLVEAFGNTDCRKISVLNCVSDDVFLPADEMKDYVEDRILLHYCRDIRQQFSEGTLPLKPPVGRFGKELKQVVSGLEA